MKKSVLGLALAFGVSSAFAQDLTSKKGEPILPEAGDWAISADATPFLGYLKGLVGNNQSGNQAPTFNFLGSNNLIMGKYFKDEKTAYRGGLNIGFQTQSTSNLVNQDHLGTQKPGTDYPKVTDKQKVSTTGIGLSAGLEKRKGKTRLQGYYGAEVFLWIGSTHQKNTYGNAFTDSTVAGGPAQATSTSQYASGTAVTPGPSASFSPISTSSRVTDIKDGKNFQFGVRGFIGVEYFILPKMSLGGEFGWGIGIQTWGAGQTTTETAYVDPTVASTSPATASKTYSSVSKLPAKGSQFTIGTDNKNSYFGPTGSIRFNFYF